MDTNIGSHRTDAKLLQEFYDEILRQSLPQGTPIHKGMPTKSDDFFNLESTEPNAIYHHILTLCLEGRLTAQTRRQASQGAKDFLMFMCQNDIKVLPRTPQTEGLIRVILAGYASKSNVVSIISGENPIILDKHQIETAISHSGSTYQSIYNLACEWWDTLCLMSAMSSLEEPLTYKQQQEQLPQAYEAYKTDPSIENANLVILYLLPIAIARVCILTDTPPTKDQASKTLSRAKPHGSGYVKAVKQYIMACHE